MVGNYIGAPIGGVIPVNTNGIFGELAVTLDDVAVTATAAVEIVGQSSVTLDDATFSATGELAISGEASVTLDDTSLTATGAVDIVGTQTVLLDDVTLVATGALEDDAAASITLDDVDLSASGILEVSASANITLDDVTLFADSTLRLPQTGSWAPETKKPKRKSRKDHERLLDQALAKAFEPKRGPKRPAPEPWLAEPILPPEILPIPEFNPAVADLSNYVTQLQQQLAQRKFELSQMEADDELLLLSL